MVKKELSIITADYSQETILSIHEVCESCHTTLDFIAELKQYDIIQMEREDSLEWKFNLHQIERIKTAKRLQHDLEVNLAGVAVILDLLDELDELRARLALIERHYL